MLGNQISFDGVESEWQTGVVILLVALPAILAILLSRSERRSVAKWRARWMLGLRAALFCLVLVSLLRPVVLKPETTTTSHAVVIAVDVSQSMATHDLHANDSEKIGWARTLGMIGNSQTDGRLDRWSQAFEAGIEPEWVSPNEVADPDERQRLANSRRENLENVLSQVDQLTRQDICTRLLTEKRVPSHEDDEGTGEFGNLPVRGRIATSEHR